MSVAFAGTRGQIGDVVQVVGFAGTALMGDGGVLMVLNPKELL